MLRLKLFGFTQLTHFLMLLVISGTVLILASSCSGEKKAAEEYTIIKNVKVENTINNDMAEKGKKVFQEKCMACHRYETKLVGPPLGQVTGRRTPDYIMSMILNPELMLKNNDTTKALLSTYLTPMANQHVSTEDARAILEHLRDISAKGGK